MKFYQVVFCILLFNFYTGISFPADGIVIGVLAKRGVKICYDKWNATATYLNESIPDHKFVIQPLHFNEIKPAVRDKTIDFLLANPAIYVEHEYEHGAQRIATLINRHGKNSSTEFGGVIFSLSEREDLQTLQHLKKKSLIAVDENSFGGWITAWREFKIQHIHPFRDFKTLTYAGTHDSVVYAVQNHLVDAGVVRTEILERMSYEGKINLKDFHIFPSSSIKKMNLPFQVSTTLYPEWPIAKLPHVSDTLSKDVAAALLKLTKDHPAALAAQIAGWTVPLNYQSVHECLKSLELPPYQNIHNISFNQLLRQYWPVILTILILMIVFIYLSLRIYQKNLKLKRIKVAMEDELYLRKQTEAALVKEKEKAELIFQVVPSAIFTINTECEITGLNQRAAEILGYQFSELLGKKCHAFAMSPCSELCGLFKGNHKGIIRGLECTIQNKKGDVLIINKNAQFLYDNSGRVIGGIESFEDITERRINEIKIQESESRYRALFDKMSSGVAVYEAINNGEDFIFKSMNESGLKMDHLKLENIAGQSVKTIFPGIMSFGLYNMFKRVWETGEPEELPLALYKDNRIEAARENYVYKLPSGEVVAIYDDMTEKVIAQKEVEEAKERFELAVKGSSDGIWDWDLKTNEIYLSPRWKTQIGYLDHEMESKYESFESNLHPEDKDRVIETYQRYLNKEIEEYNIEFRLKHKDGSWRWILARGVALWDDQDIAYRMSGSHTDITDRKKAESALHESEVRYQNAERLAHHGSWQINIQTGEVSWSDEFFRICGYEPGSVTPFHENAYKIIHPDDLDFVYQTIETAIKNGNSYSVENRIIRPDSTIRWILSHGEMFFDTHNRPFKMISSFLDITERKQAEEALKHNAERLRKAQHVARLGSYEWDLEKDQLYWSDEMYTIHGIPQKNKKRTFENYVNTFVHEGDREKFRLHFKNISLKRKPKSLEYRICKPDKTIRWVENEFSLEKSKSGKLIKIIGTVHDITDRVEAFNAIARAKEAAEIANRTKSEFLANMSHEIRTPLNAILGFTEILKTKLEESKYKEYLESIDASGKTLLTLINDILDLSKIEAGKLELQYQPANAYDIFKEIEQIFSWKIKEKGLEFALQIDGTIPQSLLLDETRLRQILLNLVGNAVKFTHEGYIKLSAFKKISGKDESTIDMIISIEDTGIGIQEDQQKSIFEAFHQQAGQNNAKYGGTGLGLAITRRLVEMMNGDILLESQIDKGSVFTIQLKNIPVSSVSEPKKKKIAERPLSIEFLPATVLVVDDIPQNRMLVREYLNEFHLNVLEASNGLESIEIAKTENPDLILMDIKMPVMDGIKATQILKSEKSTGYIPVVALTASAMKEDRDRILQIGCNGYIQKPVSKIELINELKKYLEYELDNASPEKEKDKVFENIDASSQKIDWSNIKDVDIILEKLKGEYLQTWQSIQKTFIMGKIKDFAEMLLNDKDITQIDILIKWADQIIQLVEYFDIEKLPTVLDQYPVLIHKLESAIEQLSKT